MILASRHGSPETARALLDAGANASNSDDFYKRTSLHWAALNGNCPFAEVLVEALEKENPSLLFVKDRDGKTAGDCIPKGGLLAKLARQLESPWVRREDEWVRTRLEDAGMQEPAP